jgi:hypothetical protein
LKELDPRRLVAFMEIVPVPREYVVEREPQLFDVLSIGIDDTFRRYSTHTVVLAGPPIGCNCTVKHEACPDEAAVGDERSSA